MSAGNGPLIPKSLVPLASIDLNELRSITRKAIEEGQRELELKQRQEQEQKQQERQEQIHRAKGIIQQISSRMRAAATAGQSRAVIMEVSRCDYQRPVDDRNWETCRPKWLLPERAAAFVYEACAAMELSPIIEYWSGRVEAEDTTLFKTGFNIVVRW